MNLTLKIKKRTQPEWLAWVLVFAPFMLGLLFEFLPLPSVLKYVIDLVWIALVVLICLNLYHNRIMVNKDIQYISLWIAGYLLFTFLIYLFNYQSVLYYLMGIRINFRYYFSFLAFVFFLKKDDIESFLKWFDILFWINAVVMIFQAFIMHLEQDNIGGIFGIASGCNGYTNIFFVIICTKSILYYLAKKENIWLMLSKCGASLLLATISELKFFYLEFLVLIIVSVVISGNSWRKIVVISGGILGIVVFVNILFILFPYFANFSNLAKILEAQTSGYSGDGTIGRLSSIRIITEMFFDTVPKTLFGLGLGNCNTSTIDLFNTPFYEKYGDLRYIWFSTAHVTLETGYIGLLLYVGFFVLLFALAFILLKNNRADNDLCRITIVMSVCAVLIFIYNSSLRSEAGYMIFFILSLPFASMKYHKNGELKE